MSFNYKTSSIKSKCHKLLPLYEAALHRQLDGSFPPSRGHPSQDPQPTCYWHGSWGTWLGPPHQLRATPAARATPHSSNILVHGNVIAQTCILIQPCICICICICISYHSHSSNIWHICMRPRPDLYLKMSLNPGFKICLMWPKWSQAMYFSSGNSVHSHF